MDYYFNQLMEIQNSTDHSFFLLDQDSEPRFVIEADKRTIIIPAEFQFLGVKTDQRSEKIYFEVDRIFDDVDLSTKTCVIQYINAGTDDVDEGIYPVTELDTTTVPGKIVFKWEVDNIVCKYAGVVAFSVRFYEIDPETKLYTYCWNTIPENLPVLDGLNVSGSVTEDFPTELLEWNARMAALNTEITNKISTADATMKADLKTAKGYMDGAQAARGGAEDAESRVQAIVAGNESYTKQQSHDLFALALKGTAEAAKSITIYPDKGSNVIATINGFTRQAGTGDPSPTNVRGIINGGRMLKKYVITGEEPRWGKTDGVDNNGKYLYYLPEFGAVGSSECICNRLKYRTGASPTIPFVGISEAGSLYMNIGQAGSSLTSFKKALNDAYTSGDPYIVWYQPADESQATGLYAPIILQGGEYRATCLPLTAPLCEGDSVVSWVRSGCDKVLVLDGQNNGLSVQSINSLDIVNFSLFRPEGLNIINSIGYSEYLHNMGSSLIANATSPGLVISGNTIYTRLAGADLVRYGYAEKGNTAQALTAGKAYFAAHPLTVWYRSTNYTEAADIPVSLETHQRAVLVPDGTDKSHTYDRFFYLDGISGPKPQSITSGICSHYRYTVYGSGAIGVALDGRSIVYTPGEAYAPGEEGLTKWKADLAAQYAAGTPVTIVYQLATPITYAHPAVVLPALPDDTGKVTITGEADGTVSAKYNKDITYAFSELQSAILALGANLSL